jgi:hypothetical protein
LNCCAPPHQEYISSQLPLDPFPSTCFTFICCSYYPLKRWESLGR